MCCVKFSRHLFVLRGSPFQGKPDKTFEVCNKQNNAVIIIINKMYLKNFILHVFHF